MIRGGNFNNNATNLLPPNRNNNTPTNRNNNIGFRCAKTVGLLEREDARKSRGHGSGSCGDPQSSPSSPWDRDVCKSRIVPTASAVGPPTPRAASTRSWASGRGRDYFRIKASLVSSLSQSVLVWP